MWWVNSQPIDKTPTGAGQVRRTTVDTVRVARVRLTENKS